MPRLKIKPEARVLLIDYFNASYVADRLSQPTQRNSRLTYYNDVMLFDRWYRTEHKAHPRVCDLSDRAIKGAMSWMLANGRSLATANRLYRHIKAIWRFAYQQEILDSLPRTPRFRENLREPEAWTPDEVVKIVAAATRMTGLMATVRNGEIVGGNMPANVFWPALILFATSTGARISAIMNVPVKNLNLRRGWVLIPAEVQKQGADQRFELMPSACHYLRLLNLEGRVENIFDDWPFDRTVISWPYLNRWLKRIIVAAGVRDSVKDVKRLDLWHKFRRTVATQITNQAGVEAACAALGHASTSTTKRYIDKRQVERRSVMRLLADPMANLPPQTREPTAPLAPSPIQWPQPADAPKSESINLASFGGAIDCGNW